jgi:DNA polymerase II small subunit
VGILEENNENCKIVDCVSQDTKQDILKDASWNTEQDNEIVQFAQVNGLILSKDAISLLLDKKNWKDILSEISYEGALVVDTKLLEKKINRTKLTGTIKTVEIKSTRFNAQAKDRAPDFRVMEEYDVTGSSHSEGKIDDFLRLFRSKFELLSTMLKTRHNLSPVPLKSLKTKSKNENVDVIGIVNKRWVTKNNHIAFEIEDLDTKAVALIMNKEKELMAKGEHILEDNVVGIKGAKVGDEFIIIKEIYWPDTPVGNPRTINEEVYSGCTSDFHIGSNKFLEEAVQKWLDYLNGKGLSGTKLERIGKLQYLFVVGDNVAGIGVYPGQLDELVIKDIYEQYAKFEELMLQIPDYIQIFICPGQHDAVRRAEPQPAIPKEFVPNLYKARNFHFISSPSWVETEGLKNLVYHGPSIHDLISSVSFLDYSKPHEGMAELLRKRDLMPKYGGRNPYVPEDKDYMVIKEVPDFVWIGDMHHNGYCNYRQTTIINGGCWEAQTDFQRKIGHIPTPGIFPIVNLKTRKISEIQFLRGGIEKEVDTK